MLEDLSVRWRYHPTFRRNVLWRSGLILAAGIAAAQAFMILDTSGMTSACRTEWHAVLADTGREGPTTGQITACDRSQP